MGYTKGNFYFFVAYTTSDGYMEAGLIINLLVVNWVNWLISIKEKKKIHLLLYVCSYINSYCGMI